MEQEKRGANANGGDKRFCQKRKTKQSLAENQKEQAAVAQGTVGTHQSSLPVTVKSRRAEDTCVLCQKPIDLTQVRSVPRALCPLRLCPRSPEPRTKLGEGQKISYIGRGASPWCMRRRMILHLP